MTTMMTGGCQCGAVRFSARPKADGASICHCRMCQKAFGSFFAPLVTVEPGTLTWTKREPKRFQSSNHVQRGFCPECGTPLTYEAPDGVALAIGAFDEPAKLEPIIQFGTEGKLPYVDEMPALPARRTLEDGSAAVSFLHDIVSYQHGDAPGEDERPGKAEPAGD